ncbi:MAG: hypothetical protein AAFU64_08030 [Bacteroidota bacterium]
MKNTKTLYWIGILWILGSIHCLQAQQGREKQKSIASRPSRVNSANIQFANPTVPGTLVLENYLGDVKVEGYTGEDVKIEARLAQLPPQYYFTSTNGLPFSLSEQHNTVYIKAAENLKKNINRLDFNIKVPEKTSLRLKIINGGTVEARNIHRLVEVDNQNGSVSMQQCYGWAVVNAINGDIYADFEEVIDNKAMSFVTLNGDVYLDLPKNTRADFRLKSTTGQINNDFGKISTPADGLANISQAANILRPENETYELHDVVTTKNKNSTKQKKKGVGDQETNKKDSDSLVFSQSQGAIQVPNNYFTDRQATYVTPQAFVSKANGGGAIYFISTREGLIEIRKTRKKKKE